MLRNMSSGSSINLTIVDGGTAGNGTFPSGASAGEDYDNMKQLRRDSSLFDDARTPSEIASSIWHDFSWTLARDLVISVVCFLFGVHGPKPLILPLIGGLTMRPIPYQVTAAGDVLLDLPLANDMVPKPDATFNCKCCNLCIPLLLLYQHPSLKMLCLDMPNFCNLPSFSHAH